MQIINQIVNISLERLNFGSNIQSIEDYIINNQLNIQILTGLEDFTLNDEKLGSCNLLFALLFIPENEKQEDLTKENFEKLDAVIKIKYNIDFQLFTSEVNFSQEEINNEILSIVEPFIREEVSHCINNSKLSIPPLPYRFWEN